MEFAAENELQKPVKRMGIGDEFIGHGSVEELEKMTGLDESSIEQEFEHLLSNLKSGSK